HVGAMSRCAHTARLRTARTVGAFVMCSALLLFTSVVAAVATDLMPTPGPSDCCQCANFCAAPIDGTCGGCSVAYGASCSEGALCVTSTPTATPTPTRTPTPTKTPATSDCCQCPTSCTMPVGGSCGDCIIVLQAVCGDGMLCVVHTATPTP